MARHNYGGLSFLIVDDFANFCSALRTMVMSYGVTDIDVVHNGDEALRQISAKRYDVVLSDYNLGDGRNGNDVLEESKHRNLLKSGCLYLMLTAENTADMVRGALEYQPDDYLTKPFTKEVLLTRLERLLDRNDAFREVYRLRDREQLGEAAEVCAKIAAERGRYSGFALKLQAELLMQAKRYGDATALYQQVLMIKNLAWAKLGLGKSFYYQEQLDKAIKTFSELVAEDGGYVQAWDWLARCQQQSGDSAAAQASLEAAVKVSPVNIRRQTQLGELALANGDAERAELALGRAVKIGKHSVFRDPDTYIKFSEVLVKKFDSAEGLSKKNAEMKALGTMDELRQLYKGNAEINLRSRLMDHQIHTARGSESDADKALFKAYDICQQDETGELRAELKETLVSRLGAQGRADLAENLVQAMQQEESGHNRQAVELYDQGEIKAALRELQLAVRDKPRSYAVNLNMAQVAMHHIVKFGMDKALLAAAGAALKRVEGIGGEDPRAKLYHNLRTRYLKLMQRQESGE